MFKKINVYLSLLMMLFISASAFGEINTEDEIELSRSYIEAHRQTIVASVMELTEEESRTFWPVYKEYRANIESVNDRFIELVRKYADHYENLSDAVAAEMMVEYLDIEEDRLIYKRISTEQLSVILRPSKVARFFQMENKMDAIIKFDLVATIPLIFDKEKIADEEI